MATVSGFPFDTSGWPTSGDVTTANSGFAAVSAVGDFVYGSDSDGTYVEDVAPTAGGDYFDVISLASAAGELSNGGSLEFTVTMKISTDGVAVSDFANTITWFSQSTMTVRHVGTDYSNSPPFRSKTDNAPSALRWYSTGTQRGSGGAASQWTFIPTNTLFDYTVRVEQISTSAFNVRYFINGELIGWDLATDLGSTGSNKGRIVRIRSLGQSGTKIRARYYGFNLVKDEAVARPTTSTGSQYRAIPVPVLSGYGQWEDSGTITFNQTMDQSNDPDGYALAPRVPQTRAPMVTMETGSTLTTATEIGTPLTSGDGKAVVRFPLVWLSAGTAVLDLIVRSPSSTSAICGVRFAATGNVQQTSGATPFIWSNVTDEGGATMTWEAAEAYEVAIHFAPGVKPAVVLHKRSASITAEETLTAGRLTTASATGVPTIGDLHAEASGTGTVDFGGAWLQTYQWLAGFSSYTHTNDVDSNPSYFGGASRVLLQAREYGGDIGWGQEIPGFEQDEEYVDSFCAIGRSGADLADFEANNPAWSDLLPLMPAARVVMFESCINHIATQRTNGDAAINTARDEAIQDAKNLIDAAASAGVRVDFVTQWPSPNNLDGAADDSPGDSNSIELPPSVTAAVDTFNTQVLAYLKSKGKPRLFTAADIRPGRVESDFFTHGSGTGDVIHYNDSGEFYAYSLGLANRVGVGASRARARTADERGAYSRGAP